MVGAIHSAGGPGGHEQSLKFRGGLRWRNLTVQLAVALAFADASIVVLALPEIIVRLHTSISHVIWVIMAYNLALVATALLLIRFARRLNTASGLIAGLVIFGCASIGCGLADTMGALIPFRCLQGAGGAILLSASLPVFAGDAGGAGSPPQGWSAAAAIGMAVGPAAGGLLTQLFDWRAIFLAQAPIAALTIALVSSAKTRSESLPHGSSRSPIAAEPAREPAPSTTPRSSVLDPLMANAGLTLLSAGLISALFLAVLLLIDVWRLTPIAAAAVLSTIPLATALADRVARKRRPAWCVPIGATLLAGGVFGLSLVSHRELGLVLLMLALLGAGLGLSFPGLTVAALRTSGPLGARAAKTVSARDAGIVLGLVILTPVFVSQLKTDPNHAVTEATRAVLRAPLPAKVKLALAPGLLVDYEHAASSQLPDFTPTFRRVAAHATPRERASLGALHEQLDTIVEDAVTGAFDLPLRYGALFALGVLVLAGLLGIGKAWGIGRRAQGTSTTLPWL